MLNFKYKNGIKPYYLYLIIICASQSVNPMIYTELFKLVSLPYALKFQKLLIPKKNIKNPLFIGNKQQIRFLITVQDTAQTFLNDSVGYRFF